MMISGRILIFAAIQLLLLNWTWAQEQQAVKTEIVKLKEGYTIMRDGQPYFIRGAGGTSNMEKLKAYGGNSIRTWSPQNGTEILNKAQQLGLTVTLGLDVKTERHGFDYNDEV